MTIKRIATVVGLFVGLVAIISLIASVSTWKTGADTSHQTTDKQEQRTLPEIVDALDKITDKLEDAEKEKQHTAKLCRAGKIIDRALCESAGVNIPDSG